jgi:hypothetical protein
MVTVNGGCGTSEADVTRTAMTFLQPFIFETASLDCKTFPRVATRQFVFDRLLQGQVHWALSGRVLRISRPGLGRVVMHAGTS